jgi:hypothetical protein
MRGPGSLLPLLPTSAREALHGSRKGPPRGGLLDFVQNLRRGSGALAANAVLAVPPPSCSWEGMLWTREAQSAVSGAAANEDAIANSEYAATHAGNTPMKVSTRDLQAIRGTVPATGHQDDVR